MERDALGESWRFVMESFSYSDQFKRLIVGYHRGMENWPYYGRYVDAHLGGPNSRVVNFSKWLCPEIEYHCGSLGNTRVLDFGCGTGASTVTLAENAKETVGFDIDRESIDICRLRLKEHGLEGKAAIYCSNDIGEIRDELGTFDIVHASGVLEHIPLSRDGARRGIVTMLMDMLRNGGCLVVNDTPNRLWPFDFHTTHLWWIPWTRPGSQWAYNRAVARRRHGDSPRTSKGPMGLEERGSWGVTYWEIKDYVKSSEGLCVNTISGHDRHIWYVRPPARPPSILRKAFEFVAYYTSVKLLGSPIVAFYPTITCLVIKKDSH